MIGRARIPEKQRTKIANDNLYTDDLDRVTREKSRNEAKVRTHHYRDLCTYV